ncbi:MAG: hypothetical protein LC804_25405 [Acidobacteria bacterium]|nr:hypothetical protein [Acidobacteriota bacterium]
MLKLIERNIAAAEERLVLLPPPESSVPGDFKNAVVDSRRHNELIAEMQRLRGSIYLQDGAVPSEHLLADGSHQTPEDKKSWHLLMLDKYRRVSSCVWYLEHDNTTSVEQLRVRNCPLVRHDDWRGRLRHAVESELARARRDRLHYAEVGGWAVSPRSRCTSEGLLLALAAYSLGRVLGGALGITTATIRHSSSSILRRLGGSHLEVDGLHLPSYYDPKYKCEMELLRFDSRKPDAKYARLIELLRGKSPPHMRTSPPRTPNRNSLPDIARGMNSGLGRSTKA